MARRKLRDRPCWVSVGSCQVRVSVFPSPAWDVRNLSGRVLTDEDRNLVTRYVLGELEEAGFAWDALKLRDAIWSG